MVDDRRQRRRWVASYALSLILHGLVLVVFLLVSFDVVGGGSTEIVSGADVTIFRTDVALPSPPSVTLSPPPAVSALSGRTPKPARSAPPPVVSVPPTRATAPAIAAPRAAPAPARPRVVRSPQPARRPELARNIEGAEPQARITPQAQPTPEPAAAPTFAPNTPPTSAPLAVVAATSPPTPEPTAAPTPEPTAAPTALPTRAPTPEPTAAPTALPTRAATPEPTAAPTAVPTAVPTKAAPDATVPPTQAPTTVPSLAPRVPTQAPARETAPAPTIAPRATAVPIQVPPPSSAPGSNSAAQPGAAARSAGKPGAVAPQARTSAPPGGSSGPSQGPSAPRSASPAAGDRAGRGLTLNDRLKALSTGGDVDYRPKRVAIGDAQGVLDGAVTAYEERLAPPPEILRKTFGFIYERRSAAHADSIAYVYDTYSIGPLTICKAWKIVEHPNQAVHEVGAVAGSAGIGGGVVTGANSPVVRHDDGGTAEAGTIQFPCTEKSYTAVRPGSLTAPLARHPDLVPTPDPAASRTPAPSGSLAP